LLGDYQTYLWLTNRGKLGCKYSSLGFTKTLLNCSVQFFETQVATKITRVFPNKLKIMFFKKFYRLVDGSDYLELDIRKYFI